MNTRFTPISLLLVATLILLFVVSCVRIDVLQVEVATGTPDAAIQPTFTPILTTTEILTCDGLCPSDSMTATAAMGATFESIPSNTPPAGATVIPSAGNLGWGSVYGIIVDGVTGLPLEGATVWCEHASYVSSYLCHGVTTTNAEGRYLFNEIFFHDTDRITLVVEAPGYTPLRFEQAFFTRPESHQDLGLFPVDYVTETSTPTPYMMCTPPACSGGVLVCEAPNGCPGGCGTICLMATPTP